MFRYFKSSSTPYDKYEFGLARPARNLPSKIEAEELSLYIFNIAFFFVFRMINMNMGIWGKDI